MKFHSRRDDLPCALHAAKEGRLEAWVTDSYERTRELCHRKKLQRSASMQPQLSQPVPQPSTAHTAPLPPAASMCANASGSLSRSASLCARASLQAPMLSRQPSMAVPVPGAAGAPSTPPARKLTAADCVSALAVPSITPEALTRQTSVASGELQHSPSTHYQRLQTRPSDRDLARAGSLSISELSTALTAKLADMLASPEQAAKSHAAGTLQLVSNTPPPPNTPDRCAGADATLSPFVMRAARGKPAPPTPIDTLPEDSDVVHSVPRPLQKHKSLQRSMRVRGGPASGATVRKNLKAMLSRASRDGEPADLAASGSLSGYSPSAVSSDLAAVWQVPQARLTPAASAELPRAESCCTFAAAPSRARGGEAAPRLPSMSLGV